MPPRHPPADWIAVNLLPGLGPLGARRALAAFGTPGEVAHRAEAAELALFARGVEPKDILAARRTLAAEAERELARAALLGARVLAPDDPDWPAEFETLPDAPLVLYVRGRLEPGRVRLAVVGSRRPTAYGRRIASGIGESLAARGIVVVSGGARGIDGLAHRGALEGGGRTIAVLGSGLARPYPSEHAGLFDEIAGAGAVVSEFPLDTPPLAAHFPRRNRLISALAAGVVVVEAAERSGSLITAGLALEQGREVFAVPGPVTSDRSTGCHRLIQQGAKLVQSTDDIVEELSPMYRQALDAPPAGCQEQAAAETAALAPDEAAVLGLLDEVELVHVDDLAERAPFGIARLQTALFGLLLRGSVEERSGRYYLCRPRAKRV